MVKRTNNGSTPASGRSRAGNGPTIGNGENRPALAVKTNDKGQIFSHIRQKWLAETPEERVRQAYALYCNAPFFVTHNNRETRYWRTRKDRMPGNIEEIENIPHASDKEIEVKYADESAAETARLEALIEAAKQAKDADARKAKQAELRVYLNRMADTKTREARALLKERFDYPIFLYEAEKVGITATGEPDANELYPNDRMPAGITAEETCLELYRRFRKKPAAFSLEGSHS